MWNGDTRLSSSSRARLPGFKHVRARATRKVNSYSIMSETEISLEHFSFLSLLLASNILMNSQEQRWACWMLQCMYMQVLTVPYVNKSVGRHYPESLHNIWSAYCKHVCHCPRLATAARQHATILNCMSRFWMSEHNLQLNLIATSHHIVFLICSGHSKPTFMRIGLELKELH